MNGFFGEVININLTDQSSDIETIPEETYKKYLGGCGIASKLLYDKIPPLTDPLGEKSILGFFPGLLTGSMAPLSGRFIVVGKSPLTDSWGEANCGGYFGPEIKKCGFDGILVHGKAEKPMYLSLEDKKVTFHDAKNLWRKNTYETEELVKRDHPNSQVASIGKAGENLSLISGIVTDKGRIAARSGLGAVMGSKKLKALVIRGSTPLTINNKEDLLKLTNHYNEKIEQTKVDLLNIYKTLGTSGLLSSRIESGDTPIKNWGGNVPDDFKREQISRISGEELLKYKQRDYGCFACSVRCGKIIKAPNLDINECHIPEYQSIASFGPLLLNDDLSAIIKFNDMCNKAGMDTISAGATIAFAIECFENGILNDKDTDGLKLKWGDSEAIKQLLEKMINRKGFGDFLADGSKKASKKLGIGGDEFAIHSLGQELPMHDPKFHNSLGLTYAYDPLPGRHTAPSVDFMSTGLLITPDGLIDGFSLPKKFKEFGEGRFRAQKLVTSLKLVLNSLGLCEFLNYFQKYPLKEILTAITGWELSNDDLMEIGWRIQTLKQSFTIKQGIILSKNTLPGRSIGAPPFKTGPHQGKHIEYRRLYRGYCRSMGWNPDNGYPMETTLEKLELGFIIPDIYK